MGIQLHPLFEVESLVWSVLPSPSFLRTCCAEFHPMLPAIWSTVNILDNQIQAWITAYLVASVSRKMSMQSCMSLSQNLKMHQMCVQFETKIQLLLFYINIFPMIMMIITITTIICCSGGIIIIITRQLELFSHGQWLLKPYHIP